MYLKSSSVAIIKVVKRIISHHYINCFQTELYFVTINRRFSFHQRQCFARTALTDSSLHIFMPVIHAMNAKRSETQSSITRDLR